jgi:hypothetical protein
MLLGFGPLDTADAVDNKISFMHGPKDLHKLSQMIYIKFLLWLMNFVDALVPSTEV